MRSKNVFGIIFTNTNDDKLTQLTPMRTMGSVPFGCRYRLIDFALSSMVNAGISNIGLIAKRNFQSLSDHVGSGRPWDLSRKKGGLCILSPFSYMSSGVYKGKIDALFGVLDYLEHAKEEYVLISDANVVANIDVDAMINTHSESGADITVVYKKGIKGETYVKLDGDQICEFTDVSDNSIDACCYLDMLLIKKDLLLMLVQEAQQFNYTDLNADILQRKVSTYKICGFEVKQYAMVINSIQSYFEANMSLLDKNIRDQLFAMGSPVYTKLRDDMPSRYGFGSSVSDSLIADGCVIDGEVKNSIIFRGVKISKGAKVENCILMQSANVGVGTQLSYVIADKDVTFKENRTLMGYRSFPMVIGKGLTV